MPEILAVLIGLSPISRAVVGCFPLFLRRLHKHMHVFLVWKDTGEPGGNPMQTVGKNKQTAHRKAIPAKVRTRDLLLSEVQ